MKFTPFRPDFALAKGFDVPCIQVLLATRNGELHLPEQLASLAAQEGVSIRLWVSDDKSTDRTLRIIRNFAHLQPALNVTLLAGPGLGHVRDFLSLACNPTIEGDFFAFADQDDIWHTDKLAIAIRTMQEAMGPAVYFSRTRNFDAAAGLQGMSPLFKRAPGLKNALVQSIGGGNTAVFNEAARRILIAAGDDVTVAAHDWWTYIAISACGGTVFYDPEPHIDYRQHRNNVVGAGTSLHSRARRLIRIFGVQLKGWLDANLAALKRIEHLMPAENWILIRNFEAMRAEKNLFRRMAMLRQLGLYRQTWLGTMSLKAAVLLKRL